ncbi:hypothetical protein Bbelb_204970 [Branchiostoma belcheri]|nr:hypothetical protein Bbelb_204970 [Branchiostoma belcheri]
MGLLNRGCHASVGTIIYGQPEGLGGQSAIPGSRGNPTGALQLIGDVALTDGIAVPASVTEHVWSAIAGVSEYSSVSFSPEFLRGGSANYGIGCTIHRPCVIVSNCSLCGYIIVCSCRYISVGNCRCQRYIM